MFRFLDNCIWKCCYKLFLLRREYMLPAVNGLTNIPKILHIAQKEFFTPLPSQGSINMLKVLSLSFEQCFGPFAILLVKGSSETGLFRVLFNYLFRCP